ncbi:hypothetical protein UMC2_37301 [[Clostridium] sordellii]|uniref:hypothetical protein n=1 Tax=Paraclostridium sordellii TaxID=1505 RepID=UPI000543D865|nr:hypothetical protein [Paeniclostridium sordellii]CEK34519.1 hypothetical protein UMC2_37301 [[Clostridium] sordellii] [Paeniclostridium sordellii]
MKVEILRKKLTATELGVAGTNDWYIDIPQESKDFVKEFSSGTFINFEDKATGTNYSLKVFRKSDGSQIWLKLFNQYKKDKGLKCADEIILEKNIQNNGNIKFYIDAMKYQNRYELEYVKKQSKFQTYLYVQNSLNELFENNNITILDNSGNLLDLNIIQSGSYKKRKDAANENYLYTIENLNNFINDYNFESLIIQLKDTNTNIYEIFKSVKYTYSKIEY